MVIFTIGNSTYFEVKIPENSGAERDFSLHFGFQTNWVSRRAREEWQFFFMKQASKMALEAAADAIAKKKRTHVHKRPTRRQRQTNAFLGRLIRVKKGYPKFWPHWLVPLRTRLATFRTWRLNSYPAVITSALLALFL